MKRITRGNCRQCGKSLDHCIRPEAIFCNRECYFVSDQFKKLHHNNGLSLRGKKKSNLHKIRIGLAHKGMPQPWAAKSLPHGSGKKNSFYGRHHTEATKKILRERTIQQLKSFPKKSTKPERALSKILKSLNINFKEQVSLLNITLADFVDLENMIVFYADGDYWHRLPEYKIRDARINKSLSEKGWTVLRFWEKDLLNNQLLIINKIKESYKGGHH